MQDAQLVEAVRRSTLGVGSLKAANLGLHTPENPLSPKGSAEPQPLLLTCKIWEGSGEN